MDQYSKLKEFIQRKEQFSRVQIKQEAEERSGGPTNLPSCPRSDLDLRAQLGMSPVVNTRVYRNLRVNEEAGISRSGN